MKRIAKTFQALEFQEHKKTLGNIKVPKIKEPVFNWQSVMNDIRNIIYRILWLSQTKIVNEQYTSMYYEKNGVIFLYNTNGYAFQYRRSYGIGGWRFIWHITNAQPYPTNTELPRNFL